MGEYEVVLDDDLKLVRANARGDVSKSLGHEIITEARTLAAKMGYAILCDVRDANLQVALADWFFLPRELDVLREGPTRSVRVAVVFPPDATSEYRFYETVATNVGLKLKVFLDEHEALDWIT
jgi:hypothetical protein